MEQQGLHVLLVSDPTNAFPDVDKDRLHGALGILPHWVIEWNGDGLLVDHLAECYQFPMPHLTGGKIDKAGIYQYPDDPPLRPYMMATFPALDVTVWFYAHAMITIVQDGLAVTVRMD